MGIRFAALAGDDEDAGQTGSTVEVPLVASAAGAEAAAPSDMQYEGRRLASSLRSEITAIDVVLDEHRGSASRKSWQAVKARAVMLLAPLEAEGF